MMRITKAAIVALWGSLALASDCGAGATCDARERQEEEVVSWLALGKQSAGKSSGRRRRRKSGYTYLCDGFYPVPRTEFGPVGGTDPYGVCQIGNPQERCEYLKPYQLGATGLITGFAMQDACKRSGANNCYKPKQTKQFFQTMGDSYRPYAQHVGAVYKISDGSFTYSLQDTRALIKEYFGDWLAHNFEGANFTAPWETELNYPFPVTASSNDIQDRGLCTFFPKNKDKPAGFLMFGPTTKQLKSGVGFVLLDKQGLRLRQYAFGLGVNGQDTPIEAAGYCGTGCTVPKKVKKNTGKVSKGYRKFIDALLAGDAKTAAKQLTGDAKFYIYNIWANDLNNEAETNDPVFTAKDGPSEIQAFFEKLLVAFGKNPSIQTDLQKVEEPHEAAGVGNSFSAFKINGSNGVNMFGLILVFTPKGKIYGGGFIGTAPGLKQI